MALGTQKPRMIYLIIYLYLLERLTRRRYDRMIMFCFEEEIQLFLIYNVNMDYLYIYHQGGYISTGSSGRDRTWLILLEQGGQNRRFFDQSEQRGRNWLAVTM